MKLNIVKLGKMDYKEALEVQYTLLKLRQEEKIDDTLIVVEHPPVITMGKNALDGNVLFSEEALSEHGISLYSIERGGDVTYHGDGQMVGYPIFNLRRNKIGIKNFVDTLERVFIDVLDESYGVHAGKDDEHTGVWVGQDKIVAIGLAVKRGVTMHGFAMNINTNLMHFGFIVPCGIVDRGVTSLEKLTGEKADFEDVNNKVINKFASLYGFDGIRVIPYSDLLNIV